MATRGIKRCFSAGHGSGSRGGTGYDSGATGSPGKNRNEGYVNRMIAYRLSLDFASLAEPTAFRDAGEFLEADDEAANWGAKEFYEIHCNAGGGTGTEVFVNDTPVGNELVQGARISAAVSKAGGLTNRGVKKKTFAVLKRHTGMRSWLIEWFFIDNDTDWLKYNKRMDSMELACVNAILAGAGRKPATVLPRKTVTGKARIWSKKYLSQI